MQSNYFIIFNDFTQNSTYMKKGSFTSKLSSPFFIKSKFKLFRQGQLPVRLDPLLSFSAARRRLSCNRLVVKSS